MITTMPIALRALCATAAAIAALCGGRAEAQEPGLGGILGGYGAMAGAPSGTGANVVVPAGRGLGAGVALGMGTGGLSFPPRRTATMEPARRPFALGAMPDMNRAGMGARRPFALTPASMGQQDRAMRRTPAAPGMGVMPPSIGYPFRQPPSLVAPAVPGMSM